MREKTETKTKIGEQLKTIEKQSYELEPLRGLPIFDEQEIKKLSDIKEDLSASFKKLELGRPKYLMEVSVLKDTKFPTPDAKYWQCILERNVQFQNLLFEALDFEEKIAELKGNEAEIEELEEQKQTKQTEAKLMKLDVQKKRLLLQMLQLKKKASERYREIMAWTELIEELRPKLKYDESEPEKHMPESYLIKFAEQKRMIEKIGASDMDGAMNILGLGESAARYWKGKEKEKEKE